VSRDVSATIPEVAAVDVVDDVAPMSRRGVVLSRLLSQPCRVGSPDQHATRVGLFKGPTVAVSWSPGLVDAGWPDLLDKAQPLARVARVATEHTFKLFLR
jgi:hypothetical protein